MVETEQVAEVQNLSIDEMLFLAKGVEHWEEDSHPGNGISFCLGYNGDVRIGLQRNWHQADRSSPGGGKPYRRAYTINVTLEGIPLGFGTYSEQFDGVNEVNGGDPRVRGIYEEVSGHLHQSRGGRFGGSKGDALEWVRGNVLDRED